MDRARHAGAARSRRCVDGRRREQPLIRPLAPAALALATTLACGPLELDPDVVVALEVVLPNGGVAELTDTLRPSARALNGYGDSVMAEIFWASLDTATIAVLDSETGVTLAKAIGIGRLQARAGALRSNPQSVTVLARLDSMRADGPIRNTVTVSPPDSLTPPDSLSDSLRIAVFATGGAAERRRAVYVATVFPPGGPAVRVAPNDTVLTDGTGIAVAQVRLLAGPLPDSVVVTATVRRPAGAAIPGSPVTFVVEFRP